MLRPQEPLFSRAGNLLGVVCVPWALGVLLAVYATLGFARFSAAELPAPTRIVLVAVAASPFLLCLVAGIVGPRKGLWWLFQQPQPAAAVDPSGIRLIPGDRAPEEHVSWERLCALGPTRSGRLAFLDAAGEPFLEVPRSLIFGRDARTGKALSLAAAVVRMRPDRYVLVDAGRLLVPTQFRLRMNEDAATDPQAFPTANWGPFLVLLAILSLAALALAVYSLGR